MFVIICIDVVFLYMLNFRIIYFSGPDVYFYAWNTQVLTHVDGLVLVFDNAITNNGNGYNSSTGVFRAPVASAYVFSWTIVSERGSFQDVALMKNGISYGKVQTAAHNSTTNASGSNTAIIELKAGEEVHLQISNVGASSQVYPGGYSTFSGWLLHY